MAGCIVCGVDDSEQARNAARLAARLSKWLDLRLVLVHAAPSTSPLEAIAPLSPAYGPEPAAEEETSEIAAHRLLRRIEAQESIDGAELRAEVGDPADLIVSVAQDEGADLIVVGYRRRGILSSLLLGSVSASVAARAPCPIVIVPEGAHVRSPWAAENAAAP
jgi:nucleotide-binding universal stress UspA family protein